MQRFAPTCTVEVALLTTYSSTDLMVKAEQLAIQLGGIPHWGQVNRQWSAAQLSNLYGASVLTAWHAFKATLGHTPGNPFETAFTQRCGL
jgi:hypothetical protein